MNPRSTRIYAPVLRSPLLFHQNTALSVPTYYTVRPAVPSSATSLILTPPSPYTRQAQYKIPAPLPAHPQLYPQSYPYHSNLSGPTFPSPMPYSYSVANGTYIPTVASNGLALILIATLILVALDLMIVRPQKLKY
ncbi:MAG: hypothetical protein P4L69_16710 [Desulfosporosinus sp.]|nr:hypothetical protein [Desulfosporosinus sp.]